MFVTKTICGIVFFTASIMMSTTAFANMGENGSSMDPIMHENEYDHDKIPAERLDETQNDKIEVTLEESEPFTAKIDIKPGDDLNMVNSESDKTLEVALIGSADFDVGNVDASTITLGEAKSNEDFRIADINADGIDDFIVAFSTDDLLLNKGVNELTLKGKTKDGKSFEGSDMVSVSEAGY